MINFTHAAAEINQSFRYFVTHTVTKLQKEKTYKVNIHFFKRFCNMVLMLWSQEKTKNL